MDSLLDFGQGTTAPTIIKVIGVGGGGGNAVNHMYQRGIDNVSFLVANTDRQALDTSPIPCRLQLGKEGLGAGDNPQRAAEAAKESHDDIQALLDDGTRMVFITAGMGGGTGTGAAPVIAEIAHNMGLLTVAIVTIPFLWEGEEKINKALDGVETLAQYADAMLVINNEQLRQIYGQCEILEAYNKANDILDTATRAIAEIITLHGIQNIDFNDVQMVLKNGGIAVMATGVGQGPNRVQKAIDAALTSPLLAAQDIFHAQRVLFNLYFAEQTANGQGLRMEETVDIHNFMAQFHTNFQIKWGLAVDNSLDDKVKITILAAGYQLTDLNLPQTPEQKEKEEQQRLKAQQRIQQYYGATLSNTHPYNFYIYTASTADNDTTIAAVDSSPTATRTLQTLNSIRQTTEKKEKETPQQITFE